MGGILVGTEGGLVELDTAGRLLTVHHPGRAVTALAGGPASLWAILDGSEVWHRAEAGRWSRAGALNGLQAHCIADTRAGVLVGTSEAHLLRLADGVLDPVSGFDDAPGRSEWHTPWGGPPDTRSLSEDGDAIYVNVHVGGIVRTTDGGHSWQPTIDVQADVHQVRANQGRLFAACARGLAVSTDRGATWELRTGGLHATYCRAIAICGDALLLSASTGPGGRHSAIYRAGIGGHTLERCRQGLPEWFEENIDSHCLDARSDGSLATFATPNGRLFASADAGSRWAQVASTTSRVQCLLITP